MTSSRLLCGGGGASARRCKWGARAPGSALRARMRPILARAAVERPARRALGRAPHPSGGSARDRGGSKPVLAVAPRVRDKARRASRARNAPSTARASAPIIGRRNATWGASRLSAEVRGGGGSKPGPPPFPDARASRRREGSFPALPGGSPARGAPFSPGSGLALGIRAIFAALRPRTLLAP